ncbi:MAG: 2-succinyl-5-enolpyruvyl-6-hydroxy-3-cyclohexene-1-carboxylic-acid synthase [Actinomycetota bacterium]
MTIPNPSTAVATVLIDELVRNGVRQMILSPGSRSGALALAGASHPQVRLAVSIDERSAGFFALGVAKATGKAAVAITTSGTATANLFPAVVEADQVNVPLVVITADRPHELRNTGANQTIDQVKLYGDKVRLFADLPVGSDRAGEPGFWRSTVCQLLAAAAGVHGRGGPVHLNVCFDEPVVPVSDDGRVAVTPYSTDIAGRSDGAPWTMIESSPDDTPKFKVEGRVLVVAGAGTRPQVVTEALAAGCVVIAEGHSGTRVPGTISTAHHLLASSEVGKRMAPERAVLLGRVGLSRNLSAFLGQVPSRVSTGEDWTDPDRSATGLAGIGGFEAIQPDQEWAQGWAGLESAARSVIDRTLDSDERPSEPRTARDVYAAVPGGCLLVVGSSMPVRDVDWFAAPREPVTVVSNRGAAGIDGIIALGMGAGTGATGTVVLAGDLSILHDQNAFLIEPRPDLVVVNVNNQGGGIFAFLPQAAFPEHFQRVFATPRPVSFPALCSVYGLTHHALGSAPDLPGKIAAAIAAGGSHMIEVRTDQVANVALHRELTAAVVSAVE